MLHKLCTFCLFLFFQKLDLSPQNSRFKSLSSLETGSITSKGADGRGEAIALVKYSPDGKFLAVGSHDNNVYLYQ